MMGRQPFRSFEKKFFYSSFAIRQTVREQREMARESQISVDAIMRVRIERVVNRNTLSRAQLLITLDHRLAASVREDEIVKWYQVTEAVIRIAVDAIKRRRSINIPKHR